MRRTIPLHPLLLLLCGFICIACTRNPEVTGAAYAKNPEITDPDRAAADPDFLTQGEYQGEGDWKGKGPVKVGAQVIARGNGQFKVVVTKGGLPGDGWKRGEPKLMLEGKRDDDVVAFSGVKLTGKIVGDALTVASRNGKTRLELKRTVRHSPTEGAKPPEGAVVLFDGAGAENFEHGTLLPDGNLLSNATTKQGFGDYTLHLEFRCSYMPEARGQARSNSGLYLHDCYEIQVLDSFGLKGKDNQCGGFYQLRKPDVNMCFPPLTWQTYDIEFVAPKYEDGKKAADARVEVRHNGQVIHPEFDLTHDTPGRQNEGPAPRPFYLQGHGNKVEYRNIWVKEKSPML